MVVPAPLQSAPETHQDAPGSTQREQASPEPVPACDRCSMDGPTLHAHDPLVRDLHRGRGDDDNSWGGSPILVILCNPCCEWMHDQMEQQAKECKLTTADRFRNRLRGSLRSLR